MFGGCAPSGAVAVDGLTLDVLLAAVFALFGFCFAEL
jgi:hypothetical protein